MEFSIVCPMFGFRKYDYCGSVYFTRFTDSAGYLRLICLADFIGIDGLALKKSNEINVRVHRRQFKN